ncbi:MAG TPA: RICIN domain-containing protein [Oligoflexus sp.]|uniref:RICIN domain-containing protein n=1 Tax=Oligoflexus sp. TaxID=1971216 RepID=UPI002D7E694C|nr:RICIN domain-containing protein [Oligoflexus sp.]HET9236812.1 RICIN domain-containing protein [Oligoflexus sp.]
MKATFARNVLVVLSLNMLALACGQRTSDTPTLGVSAQQAANSNDRTAELEKLIRDQSEALTKLSTDKATLKERADGLDAQIKNLNEQLATNKTLTETQKTEMQAKITKLESDKTSLEKQIAELDAKNKQLTTDLNNAKLENDRLQRELNAARAAANNTAAAPAATTTTITGSKLYGFKYADPNKVKNDCLGIPGNSTLDNVQMTSAPCVTGAQNQQFAIPDPVPTFFTIKPRLSAKCLTVISAAENAAVVQRSCTNTTDQSWEFFVRGAAEFRLRNQFSGKCLKIQADGKIIQGDCNLNSTYFSWFVAG